MINLSYYEDKTYIFHGPIKSTVEMVTIGILKEVYGVS